MLQLPPQSNCLDVAVGVSLLQKTRKRCHSLRYFGTLSFQWRLCLLDLLSFGNCLPLIAIRTFHRTACSLSDVRLHSSTSFVSNVFIILGKIDSHTNNQSPSIMYHFFCMYLQSLDCMQHYSAGSQDCSGQRIGHDLEFGVDSKSRYCTCFHYRVCSYKEVDHVIIAVTGCPCQVGYCLQPKRHAVLVDVLRILMRLRSHP